MKRFRLSPMGVFAVYMLAVVGLSVAAANIILEFLPKNSPWIVIVGVLMYVLPIVILFFTPPRRRLIWYVRFHRGCWPECGYDLRASKDRCPECGTPIPEDLVRGPIR